MSVLADALQAMREVVLLTDKVDRLALLVDKIAVEVREQDRRLLRLETAADIFKALELRGQDQTKRLAPKP